MAQNGSKVYGSAVTLPDGGRVDVDAACREDAPGIVVSLYHTSADFANRYTLTLQNLLSGYSTEDNGTVVIEQGARGVASNDESVAAGSGSEVLGSLKRRCAAHKLTFFRSGGQDYLGTLAHARDYYVYIYTPASSIARGAVLAGAATLAFYVAAVAGMASSRWRVEHRFLEQAIEQEHEYNEKLARAAEEDQNANTAKTEFLRRMSHDIRTPINGIRSMVEIADSALDDLERQAECRRKIWDASGFLLELGSPVHVRQMIENIAGNAAKYNRRGGRIDLALREPAFDGERATYVFTCSDTGIGMSEEFQRRAFDPFAQETSEARTEYKGTGLGLSICREIAEQMDGLEATRRIRALERVDANSVKIYAMTANAFADDAARCREAGMDDHLAKPLDSKALVAALRRVCG